MTDGRHRVALVTSSFHPHVGGVEEHVRQVALALRAQGHDVVVWTVDRGEHLGVQTVDGVLVRYLPTPLPTMSPRGAARFARAAPSAWRAWRHAVHTDHPDLLHVHCFGPNGVYAAALSERTRLPLFVTSHGETTADDHDAYGQSWLLRQALTRALRRAVATTAPSRAVLTDLRRRFGLDGGLVVPNGVQPNATGVRLRGKGEREPVIVAVGRVERVKGFDIAGQALPTVRSAKPAARLLIGGDGSMAAPLARLADEVGVGSSVHVLGWLDAAEVAGLMSRADVVVVPSRREAFGIVVLEAWRAGAPVIAAGVDGLADLIDDEVTGLLVDPEDPTALGNAILRVLSDPGLASRLSVAGLVAAQRYSWPNVASAYEVLYREQPPARRPWWRSPSR